MLGLATMPKYINWDDVPLVLGTTEVAEVLGIHINTVKHLISRGELPAYKIGRVLKVNRADVMKLVGLAGQKESEG